MKSGIQKGSTWMEILNLSLPAVNRFASHYLEQSEVVRPFFHYLYNDLNEDNNRLKELKNRKFPRKDLADYIENFMSDLPTSTAVKRSINKLKQEDSVVVIGGQQAGILTGPLYSIHKIISIIKLAEQKEKLLGVPVVPVFWIAGEDHDFQEVNHVFVQSEVNAVKWTYPEKVLQKKMVSKIQLNKDVCLEWVKKLIENFGETEHTNNLIAFAEEQINRSMTFVDFFAKIIMELFKDFGLLVVDSGDSHFRKLQTEFLKKQINQHEAITFSLLEQQKQILDKGFPVTIESNENAANLFYYDTMRNERILLEYNRDTHQFVGKNGRVSFSKEELVEIALNNPEKLSNNVVTRPLMQEWLFPTLAFIAGPGEISYWAELKLVFEHFGIKMPPIVPRLNITILERGIESDMRELNLNLSDVLQNGTEKAIEQFLDTIKDKEMDDLFTTTIDQVIKQYRLLETKTFELDRGLIPLLKKNESNVLKELHFLQMKMNESVKRKHDDQLKKYARVNLALRPDGYPQERIWNIFYYLNQYGMDFVKDLMLLSFDFDGSHKVVKI